MTSRQLKTPDITSQCLCQDLRPLDRILYTKTITSSSNCQNRKARSIFNDASRSERFLNAKRSSKRCNVLGYLVASISCGQSSRDDADTAFQFETTCKRFQQKRNRYPRRQDKNASAGNRTRGWPTLSEDDVLMATANFTTKPPMLLDGNI